LCISTELKHWSKNDVIVIIISIIKAQSEYRALANISRSHYVVVSGSAGKLVTRFALCCHSHATRSPIANPPNSAQLGGIPYHSPKLHPGRCNSVGMRPRTGSQAHIDRHTDAGDHNTFRVVCGSHEM